MTGRSLTLTIALLTVLSADTVDRYLPDTPSPAQTTAQGVCTLSATATCARSIAYQIASGCLFKTGGYRETIQMYTTRSI
jgi:hypothetical protein